MSHASQKLKCSCNAFLDIAIDNDGCGQPINPPFVGMAIEKGRQIRVANKSFEISKGTHCPKIGLPFFASVCAKSKPDSPSHFRYKISNGSNLPIVFEKPRIILLRRPLRAVQHKMSKLMQQRINMLTPRFVGVNQDAFFSIQKFAVDIITEIIDKFDLQAKVPGRFSKDVFGPEFHLLLARRCFSTKCSIILRTAGS